MEHHERHDVYGFVTKVEQDGIRNIAQLGAYRLAGCAGKPI